MGTGVELEGPLWNQLGGCLKRCRVVSQAVLERASNCTDQLDCNRLGMAVAGADNVRGLRDGMLWEAMS